MARDNHHVPAVVIGLCVHGLAICRALSLRDVPVHALECNTDLPGVFTNTAHVHLVDDIGGDGLVENLLRLHSAIAPEGAKVVLFPVNDNMVRAVAGAWPKLSAFYTLSWSGSAEAVVRLLDKKNIEAQCASTGINYPNSQLVESPQSTLPVLDWSIGKFVAKPAKPLSSFKVKTFTCEAEFDALRTSYPDAFPLLVQPWIEGDDTAIYFCALHLVEGKPVANFEGRKILSNPPALGQTTAAVGHPNEELRTLTEQFFRDTNITGPVSLEMKMAPNGEYWCIEPTVGRSDFWVGCCTDNGVNLPYVEYLQQLAHPLPEQRQTKSALWLDTDTDPVVLGTLMKRRETRKWLLRKPAFSFFKWSDPWPFVFGIRKLLRRKFSPNRKLADAAVFYPDRRPLPENLSGASPASLFLDPHWFNRLSLTMSRSNYQPFRVALGTDLDEPIYLPVMERFRPLCREAYALANYYSPIYAFVGEPSATDIDALIDKFDNASPRFDVLNFSPIDADSLPLRNVLNAFRSRGWLTQEYFSHGNWYLHCAGVNHATFLSNLPSKTRRTIKRRIGGLDKTHDVRIQIYLAADSLKEAFAAYETVYAHSWKKVEPFPEFIRDIASWCAENGWLRLGILYIDGQPAAAQIWLVRDAVASIFKLAFDEAFRPYSPGTILSNELFRYVLDEDHVEMIDYLSGDDPYKKEWMTERRERWGFYAFNPRTAAGLLQAARHIIGRKAKRLVLGRPYGTAPLRRR